MHMEKQLKHRPLWSTRGESSSPRRGNLIILALFLLNTAWLLRTWLLNYSESKPNLEQIQQCAIDNLRSDLSFLDTANPITADEFLERRDRLARALVASEVDAFVLEPGYTFQYYGNTSQNDWEPWEPEERPFLMLILPLISESGAISARTAFLAPHFEEGRVRMLNIPSRDPELDIVIWEEHWDPYTTLLESHLFANVKANGNKRKPKLMIDEEMRDFIARGLANTGFETFGLSPEAELIRQIKSPTEIEVLRAVNTGTVAAVRAMRPCLVAGLTEDEVRDILDASLLSVGFGLFFNIVLFEEDGALPHGGFVVGKKKLTHEAMIVIDVGAHYLGYSSDICRSFFIDPAPEYGMSLASLMELIGLHSGPSPGPGKDTELYAEKLKVWGVVLDAQTAAAAEFKANNTAANVDLAARKIIDEAGYGYAFTHRLGHSIGVKAHESPYLNKWNTKVSMRPGMVFTNEPGIYLEGKFGVRHEDIYLVKEDDDAELLTDRRAINPYNP
ncbi:Prolidase/Aminopeptidase P-like protein [Hypoxylon trugodes]|uniref:Prolidase/Aminopeptidase P-like protein n=1 Tax=Hypoxylon trugodes TaxID=326681 RepID=UPI0021908B2A|nr:Prolidase/Aminopeptidase P-like protein [Hypoxylon trugodes]KAI1390616.1 Prolidase/Aminopeptidase P-like protein [Hypoxylon trugodes]